MTEGRACGAEDVAASQLSYLFDARSQAGAALLGPGAAELL